MNWSNSNVHWNTTNESLSKENWRQHTLDCLINDYLKYNERNNVINIAEYSCIQCNCGWVVTINFLLEEKKTFLWNDVICFLYSI